MKFSRNIRVSRAHLDMAPFASVFFLILIFIFLRVLIYTPGVHIELPTGDALDGVNGPIIPVAMDGQGRLYFENQIKSENELSIILLEKVRRSREPLTLVIFEDKSVTADRQTRLMELASKAGITRALIAMQPRGSAPPHSSTR